MSSYKTKQVTVFTGSTLDVYLVNKHEADYLQTTHEARDITSSALASLQLFQLNDGRVLEKRLHYDRDYFFKSLSDYEEMKGGYGKNYESGTLLHDNNYDLFYSCQIDGCYLVKLLETNSMELVKEIPMNLYDLYKINKHSGLFYIMTDHAHASAIWFSNWASFEYHQKLFSM